MLTSYLKIALEIVDLIVWRVSNNVSVHVNDGLTGARVLGVRYCFP